MKVLTYGCALSALVMTSLPASGLAVTEREKITSAACCPGTDNTVKLEVKGLGQQNPAATNVSNDPNWLAYRFERDGIDYLQINDLAGRVHLIIGRAEDQFWVLPAGDVTAIVSLPLQRLAVPEGATRARVYGQPEFVLDRYMGPDGPMWSIEASADARR